MGPTVGYTIPPRFQKIVLLVGKNLNDSMRTDSTTSGVKLLVK